MGIKCQIRDCRGQVWGLKTRSGTAGAKSETAGGRIRDWRGQIRDGRAQIRDSRDQIWGLRPRSGTAGAEIRVRNWGLRFNAQPGTPAAQLQLQPEL